MKTNAPLFDDCPAFGVYLYEIGAQIFDLFRRQHFNFDHQ